MPTYMRDPNRTNQWQDWANLILAIWLFISPWVLGFASAGGPPAGAANGSGWAGGNAAWNAWVLGVIVGLVALSAMGRMTLFQEWLNLLLGIWIFIAPWILGFWRSTPNAAWDHWIVGFLIFVISLSAMWLVNSPRVVRADAAHAGDRPRRDVP